MRTLDRYIARNVIAYAFASLLVLVVLQLVFAFIDEMGDVGKGDYSAFLALKYILLTAPRRVSELLPIAALLGALLGLGGMAASSEIVIIRSAGVSIERIVRSVLQAGILLMALAFLVGEFITPVAEEIGHSLRANAISGNVSLFRKKGFWVRDGSRFLFVQDAVTSGQLRGFRAISFQEDRRLKSIISADDASHIDQGWRLNQLEKIKYGEEENTLQRIDSYEIRSRLQPEMLQVVTSRPEMMSIWEIGNYIDYLTENQLESQNYKLAFWDKVVAPFATLVMLMLGVPFVFGSQRSNSTGHRLMIGVLIGIGFFLLNKILGTAGLVYGFSAIVCAIAPTLFFTLWAVIAIRRVH
ncbi:MAG: LPS export ABC transporter permease LptG [Gammaproteobacteria bacterium]|nr:MAG: LPS export ABC transporter permease LptG [Gammaproteobacteria bacterium]